MIYAADFLIDLANSTAFPDVSDDGAPWKTYPSKDGWQVCYFYDADYIDYIQHFIAPNGDVIDFWEWPDSPERDQLIAWCGRPREQQVKA